MERELAYCKVWLCSTWPVPLTFPTVALLSACESGMEEMGGGRVDNCGGGVFKRALSEQGFLIRSFVRRGDLWVAPTTCSGRGLLCLRSKIWSFLMGDKVCVNSYAGNGSASC